jgi:hypothetical protein
LFSCPKLVAEIGSFVEVAIFLILLILSPSVMKYVSLTPVILSVKQLVRSRDKIKFLFKNCLVREGGELH